MNVKKVLPYLQKQIKSAGYKLTYTALLLYFAFLNNETPRWAKNVVLGALGYLLTPIDTVVDFTPILGYTDDLGVLSFALVTIGAYVNEEVRLKARKKLQQWTGDINFELLESVEKVL